MKDNTVQLSLSELHSCSLYIDRIFQGLFELSDIGHHPKIKEFNLVLLDQLDEILSEQVFSLAPSEEERELSNYEFREYLAQLFKFFEAAIQLNYWSQKQMAPLLCHFMNKVYRYANQLHHMINQYTQIDIQLPRPIIIEAIKQEEKPDLYQIDGDTLLQYGQYKESTILSLDGKRDKQYRKLVQIGHKYILTKKYEMAQEVFIKAQNYSNTAEVLTLIAWTHSLLGNQDKAKSFCLKAIKIDPNYGPPYNDLGNYLINEKRYDEALKWFELAKKCSHYQNREYPYINSGRVYLAQKNYIKALEEFTIAKTLAPNHQELHETIERLKKSIEKEQDENSDFQNL